MLRAKRTKTVIWAAAVIAVIMAAAPMAAATGNNTSQQNQPAYWEQQGYGTCFKIEGPSTPFVMPSPPAGSQWTALIVKAGSAASTSEPHQVIESPQSGASYAHSSGKSISHVILCYAVGGTTSTTSTTTTTSTPGTTTTIAPGCDDSYTPRNISATPQKVNPGQTIAVSGTGLPGSTILITLRRPNGTIIDPGVSVVVPPSGLWSTVVPVPQNAPLGRYDVVATVDGCERATASTRIVVNNGKNASVGGTAAAPPPTTPPVVNGTKISQTSLPANTPVSVAALGVGAVLLMALRTKRKPKGRG